MCKPMGAIQPFRKEEATTTKATWKDRLQFANALTDEDLHGSTCATKFLSICTFPNVQLYNGMTINSVYIYDLLILSLTVKTKGGTIILCFCSRRNRRLKMCQEHGTSDPGKYRLNTYRFTNTQQPSACGQNSYKDDKWSKSPCFGVAIT